MFVFITPGVGKLTYINYISGFNFVDNKGVIYLKKMK